MRVLNIRIEDETLKEIDRNLAKYRYSTRTEFVRDAIRGRLTDLEKEEMIKALAKTQGASKHKSSDKQLHAIREKVFKKLEKLPKNKKDPVGVLLQKYLEEL